MKVLFIPALILGAISCKKDLIEEGQSKRSLTVENSMSSAIQGMVEYDAQHGVLVFNSLEDVYNLEEYLSNQNPYDRGNSSYIAQMLNQVAQHGYTTNPQSSGGEVVLDNLDALLQSSHPLSDASLAHLLMTHNAVGFPPSFMNSTLTGNTPFSYGIRESIRQMTSLPATVKAAILEADEDDLDKMDYVYKDFLDLFPGYQSLYEKQVSAEVLALEEGLSPDEAVFDDPIFSSGFDQLIRNEKYEIYIDEAGLLKAYSDCLEILFPLPVASAYAQLPLLGLNGEIVIPTLSETPAGLDMTTINQTVPTDFISYNPVSFDPFGNGNDDPFYGTALQTYNVLDICPKSNFSMSLDAATSLTATFTNSTYYPNVPSPPATFQYWSFGDGTGSFQANPIHTYSSPGLYTIKLTTFSTDCGCFHQHIYETIIGPLQTKDGNPACQIFTDLKIEANPNNGIEMFWLNVEPANGTPGFTSINYDIVLTDEFGTASIVGQGSVQPFGEYIPIPLQTAGQYHIEVYTIRVGGCESDAPTETVYYNVEDPGTGCCDRKEVEEDEDYLTVGGEDYMVKYKVIARGYWYKTVGGYTKAYLKNSKGKYKKIRADHEIEIEGDVFGPECEGEGNPVDLNDSETNVKNFNFESFQTVFRPSFALKDGNPLQFYHTITNGSDVIWNDELHVLNCNE